MKKRGAFFYILIVLALIAIAGLIFLLAPGREPDTPAVLLPPAATPDVSGPENPGSAATEQTIAVTPDTVQTVIGTLSRATGYSRTLTVENCWAEGRRVDTLDVWAQGENLRITVRSGVSDTVKNVLLLGREKWIWYSDREDVFHGAVRPGDTDTYQTLLTYEDVLALEPRKISDAGYTELDGTMCIFVRYTDGPFDYEHCCYVAVDTGLLMGQDSYDGGQLIYSMRSGAPDFSTPDEALFAVPDGA